MFNSPALLLSLLLASAYAAGFALLFARNLSDLLALWVAALVGFAIGQWVGVSLSWFPWNIGMIHVLEATLGALLCMSLVRWLKRPKKTP